ncbi:MAG: diguanylate cyclase [Wenzhouxiangellaceae bacterium]|nr:diguanylate cyclase [Wenzhouxiangellaceae bacterium]
MKNLLPMSALLIATLMMVVPAAAQTEPASLPPRPLDLIASETEQATALEEMTLWLERAFDEARPTAVEWIQNPALPAEFRTRLLCAAIEAARSAAALDFDAVAGPAHRELASLLDAGSERSQLHKAYGNLSLSRGQFNLAESLFRQALSDVEKRQTAERANLGTSLGVALAQQGRLDEALDAMLEAYRLYEQTEAGPSAGLLRNIGGLSIYLQDWQQAVTFSQLAIEKLGPDKPETAGIYSNLSAALTEQGNLQAALEALQTGMALAEVQGKPSAAVISNLGYVLRELGRPQEGLAQFERAAELNRAASDAGSLAISLKNIGETLILLDRRQQADDALQQSLAAYREADIKPKRLELYPVLVENLEALGRYPEALAMMHEYRDLTEQLVSADAQTRVAELQTAFDLERKERELAESERERLAREVELAGLRTEQSRQQLVRGLLVAGVVALGLFLVVLLRSLRLRTQANRLLADKNTEIDIQRKALGESNSLLHRQSIEDELTGLGNRRSLRRLLESELPSTILEKPALLMLIDLDRFKGINDRYGHPVGDGVLARFARVLRDVAGPEDVLARWGGEEFLWLVADAGIIDAAGRCRTLLDRVRATEFDVGGHRLSITCSIGVATVELGNENPQADFDLALKVADAALYEVKGVSRDGWAGFDRAASDPKLFEGSLDIDALVARGALAPIAERRRGIAQP